MSTNDIKFAGVSLIVILLTVFLHIEKEPSVKTDLPDEDAPLIKIVEELAEDMKSINYYDNGQLIERAKFVSERVEAETENWEKSGLRKKDSIFYVLIDKYFWDCGGFRAGEKCGSINIFAPVLGVDANSAQSIQASNSSIILKDKENVFHLKKYVSHFILDGKERGFSVNKIIDADPETFGALSDSEYISYYFTDKNYVWIITGFEEGYDTGGELSRLEDIRSSEFRLFKFSGEGVLGCPANFFPERTETIHWNYRCVDGWARTEDRLFRYGVEIEGLDLDKTKFIHEDYLSDGETVYRFAHMDFGSNTALRKVESINPSAIVFMDDKLMHDGENLYSYGKLLENIDLSTFEIFNKHYSRDSKNIFYREWNCHGPSSIFVKVEEADPDTFEVFGDHEWSAYANDKNNTYFEGENIGVDPNTIELKDNYDVWAENELLQYKASGNGCTADWNWR